MYVGKGKNLTPRKEWMNLSIALGITIGMDVGTIMFFLTGDFLFFLYGPIIGLLTGSIMRLWTGKKRFKNAWKSMHLNDV